ncbi:MAG: hypothetical protein ABI603_00030 [Acidobacteriota bacterium]
MTPSIRSTSRVALLAFTVAVPGLAEAQVTISSPASSAVLSAGPDFATDVLGDPWDMSNAADIAVDPAQKKGWVSLAFAGGRVGGTLAAVNGAVNGSHINFLERAYWGIINPGRTGARFPIASGVYTKLTFKMSSTGDNTQQARVYWFHNDLGDPAGDASGVRYVNATPSAAVPNGDNIFEVDLTSSLLAGQPWTAGNVRGFAIYPNSSAVGYDVQFDWVRLTTGNGHPASPMQTIAWSGGTGTSNLDVIDSGGAVLRIATGVTSPFAWNYGGLPPGAYTLRITPAGGASGTVAFRINTPPVLSVLDPDASGGEDFATTVLGNPWDMNDTADFRFDNGATIVDHLTSRGVSGGFFNGISDGVATATSQDGIPVGDPQVYLLSNNGVINTSRYRYLTFGLQVDGPFDLLRGSVARVFWGSATGPGAPYNLTVSKDIITWAGQNTYTIDLASLSAAPNGGLEDVGSAAPWTSAAVRHFRIDPHEFAENHGFHLDFVKLAAMDETAAGSFTIRFAASDPDSDPLSLSLYYDTDTNAANGRTLIASGVAAVSGQYSWNTAGVAPGVYYVYAEASDGRNAVGVYSTGPVRVTAYTPPSDPLMSLDSPQPNATVGGSFPVAGWAFDRAAVSGTGVDYVHVYAYPNPGSGQAPVFLGAAAYGQARGDVGNAFGSRFTNTGYSLQVSGLAQGPYYLAVYAHSTVSGNYQLRTASLTVVGPLMSIDYPAAGTASAQPLTISGWALDAAAPSGTGVDTLHVWAYPNPGSGQAAIFLGVAQYGQSRPDVGAAYGSRFTNSGYSLQVRGLAPQTYQFVVFSHSTATGTFNTARTVTLGVQNAPAMALDAPGPGTGPPSFTISGWALDLAASTGTGVDAVHVYAYNNPGSGTAPQFLGVAQYGGARGDVAAAFGSSQFNNSGYNLPVTGLSSGTYDIVVYSHSRVSNAFDNWRMVRITVP